MVRVILKARVGKAEPQTMGLGVHDSAIVGSFGVVAIDMDPGREVARKRMIADVVVSEGVTIFSVDTPQGTLAFQEVHIEPA